MPARMSGSCQEALPDVRQLSGDPPRCPVVVGRLSRMCGSGGRLSQISGSRWETFPDVRKWWEALPDVQK